MKEKLKLISVLESEKERLDKFGFDTHGHFLTIDFLKTGTYACDPKELRFYPLLEAAIDDYENLLLEYEIQE